MNPSLFVHCRWTVSLFKRHSRVLSSLYRCLSTSSLDKFVIAFDTKSLSAEDLKVWKKKEGLFLYDELHEPEGFLRMRDSALSQCDALVAEVCSSQRRRKMVLVFDELSDSLCRVADMAEFVRLAHPSAAFRHCATEACVSVSNLVEKMNTCVPLYQSLADVVKNGDPAISSSSSSSLPVSSSQGHDSIDQHVAELYLRDFEQTGIQLPEQKRLQVVDLIDGALQAGQAFLNGSQMPSRVHESQVPSELKRYVARDGDHYQITSHYIDSPDDLLRRQFYLLYYGQSQEQFSSLLHMLSCRHQLAEVCGFKSFAHRALTGSLAGEPEMVTSFLHEINNLAADGVQRDFDRMAEIKGSFSSEPVSAWDVNYLTRLAEVRTSSHANNSSNTSQSPIIEYFSVGTCMNGLSQLFNSLYGVSLVTEEAHHGELWSNDVRKVAVVHETEGTLGYIYCDFYARSGKPRQDCHFTIRGGRQLEDGSYQCPVVVLMLNFPPPGWTSPSLLSHSQVEVLFHETGHAMHSMLGRTRYQHVTGTRCSTDFAEVPSVLMEHFANDWRVLKSFARHYRSGRVADEMSVRHFCRQRSAFPAAELQLQVLYSMVDQSLHSGAPEECAHALESRISAVQNRFYPLTHVPNTAWYLRFSHLVGYGARYYSYLVARSIATDIWRQMFEADPFSRCMGEKLRHGCLAHGGGVPAVEIVSKLLNKPVTPHSLAQSLLTNQ